MARDSRENEAKKSGGKREKAWKIVCLLPSFPLSRHATQLHLPLIHPPWWPNNRPDIPRWPHLVAGAENVSFYPFFKIGLF